MDLVTGCRPHHFQSTDAPLLGAYVRAVRPRTNRIVRTGGRRLRHQRGKPSAWLAVLQAATRVISTYSRMLRLNPAGRQSTPAPEPQQGVSYYSRMDLEQRRDEDAH